MIDSIIGVAIPSKVVRFGKCYHGLLKMPVTQSPDTIELIIDFHNLTLVSRDNTEHLVRLSSGLGDGRYARVQPNAVYGSVVLYMHPLASMQPVSNDGRDWSGYVIFTPDIRGMPPGYAAGYHYDASFAFTPDDNGQGVLARLFERSGEIAFAKPIRLGNQVSFTDGEPIDVGLSSWAMKVFAADVDGRALYFGRFPSFYDIRDNFEWSDWGERYKAKIDKVSLAGGISPVDGEISITSQTSPVNSIPDDIYENEYEHETLYNRSTVSAAFSPGVCVDSELYPSPIVENIKNSTDGYNPPFGRPTAFMSFLRDYSRIRKETVISAALVGDALNYLVFSSESIDETNGSGDINASAEPFVFGDECGSMPSEYLIVGGSSFRVDRWWSAARNSVSRYKLEGYGGSSVIEYSWGWTEDIVGEWEVVDSVTVTDDVSEEKTTFERLTLDGKVIYHDSNSRLVPFGDRLRDLVWPSVPAISGYVAEGNIDSFLFVEKGENPVGKKAAYISTGLFNYHSSDLLALYVRMQTGTIYSDGGVYKISESSHAATLHVGKTFARGIVDSYAHEQDLINDPGRRWRAYDPLEKKVSAVYPHPVFYV